MGCLVVQLSFKHHFASCTYTFFTLSLTHPHSFNEPHSFHRFSSDTSVVDDSLPFILNILLANAVSLAGLLAVLLYSQPLLLLVVLPLGGVYR